MKGGKVLGGLALGGIAASPFLGMIGEDPVTKDPRVNPDIPILEKNDLIRQAQRGDVFAVSKPGWNTAIGKIPQALTTGSEFYHVEPVVKASPRGKKLDTVSITARMADEDPNTLMSKLHGEKPGEKGEKPAIDPKLLKDPSSYMTTGNLLLLRPKTKLTGPELDKYEAEIRDKESVSYDTPHAISSWLEDIFVPKPLRAIPKEASEATKNICSNASAVALADVVNQRVHPSVSPVRTLPVDYLREDSDYEPVGATAQGDPMFKNPLVPRIASRALLGTALAGGAYGLYKNPRAAAVLAGTIGLPTAIRAGMSDSSKLPSVPERFLSDLTPEAEEAKRTKRDFMLKTVPVAAAGGAGAYATARGVQRILKAMAR